MVSALSYLGKLAQSIHIDSYRNLQRITHQDRLTKLGFTSNLMLTEIILYT